MTSDEHPITYQSRKKIKEIFRHENYSVEEEVELEEITNNMEERIYPPYRADLLCTKQFIIELDPQSNKPGKSKGHGTKFRRMHDKWRDKNIRNQIGLKTVRLIPSDILKQTPEEILKEINYQLRDQEI